MSWVAVGVGVAGAAGSVMAAKEQSDAASNAAKLSVQSTRTARQSANQAQYMLNNMLGIGPVGDQKMQLRKEWKNWMAKDYKGLSRKEKNAKRDEWVQGKLDAMANDPNKGFLMQRFGNEQFQQDPGYQFRMDEGAKGVERSAAARGGALGGAALKELERYRQGFASNEFNNAYTRFSNDQSNIYNRLAGYQSNQQQVGLGGIDAYNQYKMAGSEARAAGIMGATNSMMGGAGMFQQNQQFNSALGRYNQGGGGGGSGLWYGGNQGELNLGSMRRGL